MAAVAIRIMPWTTQKHVKSLRLQGVVLALVHPLPLLIVVSCDTEFIVLSPVVHDVVVFKIPTLIDVIFPLTSREHLRTEVITKFCLT